MGSGRRVLNPECRDAELYVYPVSFLFETETDILQELLKNGEGFRLDDREVPPGS